MNTFLGCARRVMYRLVVATLMFGLVAPSAFGETETPPEPWLDAEPFELAPPVLLASAYAHPLPQVGDVLLLWEDRSVSFDDQGRSVQRSHYIYRVLGPAGVRDWSSVHTVYEAWRQKTPSIRARVVTPDGIAHELDPRTLTENIAARQHPQVFSDLKQLAGPLPAVAVGAVVEIEIRHEDTLPLFDAGVVGMHALQNTVATRKVRCTIDAPKSVPLRYVVQGIPDDQVSRSKKGGRLTIRVENGPMEGVGEVEALTPPEVVAVPYIAWSTGNSWTEVAERYLEIVEERIGTSNLKHVVEGIVSDSMTSELKIAAIVSKLHAEVRYTGVEFGEAGIIPATPQETLQRHYGDCKDKATLLVALLREAKFSAKVVLVDSGIEIDMERDLPGLGMFDHAIVFVEEPAVWIDPTDEYLSPGTLPAGVEGRLALVIDESSDVPIRIPATTAESNRLEEVREIFLQERGPGRVVETTRVWGWEARRMRQFVDTADDEAVREDFANYAREEYFAADLDAFEVLNLDDLAAPFELRLEIDEAERAWSGSDVAQVVVLVSPTAATLARSLPSQLDGEDEVERQHDVLLSWPHVIHRHYRIHPPPGFTSSTLPKNETKSLGPASVSSSFVHEEDGTVTAIIHFDSGKRRWSPEELTEATDALTELFREDQPVVTFEQVGARHLREGRIDEALREYRELVELHPDEALHHMEIANALLAGGMQEAAHQQVSLACDLDPENDEAHSSRGFILVHDSIGRYLGKGFEYATAERAFRKAKELNSEEPLHRRRLAILLEHDEDAHRYGKGSRLNEAIEEYWSIRRDLDNENYDWNLAMALIHAGRPAELRELLDEMTSSPMRNRLEIIQTALAQGPVDAIERASRVTAPGQERQEVLAAVAALLMQSRHYAESAALFHAAIEQGVASTESRALAQALERARRHEELEFDEGGVGFLRSFIVRAHSSEDLAKLDATYFAGSLREAMGSKTELLEQIKQGAGLGESTSGDRQAGDSPDLRLDLGLAGLEFAADGDAAVGQRVRARSLIPGLGWEVTFFVTPEEGGPKLLAVAPFVTPLGHEALHRLEAGDVKAARLWLDWAAEVMPEAFGDDPFGLPPFLRFLPEDSSAAPDSLRYAAAALIAMGDGAEHSIEVLNEGREKADDASERLEFDYALASANMQLERWSELYTVSQRILEATPDSEGAFGAQVLALSRMERWDDMSRAANAWLEQRPGNTFGVRVLGSMQCERGQREEGVKLLHRVVESNKALPSDYNNLAWCLLEQDVVTDESIGFAERAALFNDRPNAAGMHTLAALYAEVGRFSEARELLLQEMAMQGLEEPGPNEWFVFGRIAEGYGEIDSARSFYELVTPTDSAGMDTESSHRLAQRRIAGLSVEPVDAPSSDTHD